MALEHPPCGPLSNATISNSETNTKPLVLHWNAMDARYGDMGGRQKMREITFILKTLTKRFPPSGKARHNFTITPDGNLELCLFVGNQFYPFVIEEEDFDVHPEDLVDQIAHYMTVSM